MTVLDYHDATKHTRAKLFSNSHRLDWANQPNPFRRYDGAQIVTLPPLLDQLFYYSMAISAWKQIPGTDHRWALRVNPSSGNLHPTEAFVTLDDGLYHYRPDLHALERRATLVEKAPFAIVLTSIFWREAWKYQSRAFRYCHHDLGHALAAVELSAATLGLPLTAHGDFDDAMLATHLALPEGEHPGLVLSFGETPRFPAAREVFGTANVLSKTEIHYPAIDDAYRLTLARKPVPNVDEITPRVPPTWSRRVARKRRSAVDLDGKATMPLADLLDALALATHPYRADFGFGIVTPYVYAHRIVGLEPGAYRYEKGTLVAVSLGDQTHVAKRVSCFQDIAGDGCFAVSFVADLGRAIATFGDRGYRYAHFEAGAMGHWLYLAATAGGLDATGIGCFQDDEINEYLALPAGFQVVYNFTVGKAVIDERLTTLPAYDFPEPADEELK